MDNVWFHVSEPGWDCKPEIKLVNKDTNVYKSKNSDEDEQN